MNDQTNKFLIPAAIVLAGVIISAAVFYSIKNPSSNANNGNQKTAALAALPEISSSDFILGDQSAPVTVIVYSDYQCPFCAQLFKTVEPILRDQYIKTKKVKFIFRDFAFLGDESLWAANAAHCAGDQGKFWEFHDYLFNNQKGENQGAFSKDNLKNFAKALGLNIETFSSCVDSDKHKDLVQKETQAGAGAGVSGTPASFINGMLYPGILPVATYTQIIDNELNKVNGK